MPKNINVPGLSGSTAPKYQEPAKKKPAPRKSKSMEKKNEAQRGASATGFHTLNLYQNCQRKFFLRTIQRLEPIRGVAYPLLFGTAIHEAKATWYLTRSAPKVRKRFDNVCLDVRNDFESTEEFEVARKRGPDLLDAWLNKYGENDFEIYDILGVEDHVKTTLPGNKYTLTGRIDLIVRVKGSGEVYILDTKTAGFSKRTAETALALGDQATSYIYLLLKARGIRAEGLIGDIMYWNKQSSDINNIDCFRTDVIQRSNEQLSEFALGAAQTNAEMAQKAQAVKDGTHDPAIFTRNTSYCMSFFRKCEFASVCRSRMKPKGRAPAGFRRNKNIKPLANQFVYDESEGLL